MSTIWWLRQDLRLQDNPALDWAAQRGEPVVALYVHAPEEYGDWMPGAASRWWLHHSLQALDRGLRERGGQLIIRRGPTQAALAQVIAESQADAVVWNRLYEPALVARDTQIKTWLKQDGLSAHSCASHLLHEPWTIATGTDGPYRVFTPFWRKCREQHPPALPERSIPETWHSDLESLALEDLHLLPQHDWVDKLAEHWTPGEQAAQTRLEEFLEQSLANYAEDRNRPDRDGSSRLSPYLHFGEISPQRVWHAAATHSGAAVAKFQAELGWREFAHHLLWHFPHTPTANFNSRFDAFSWRQGAAGGHDLRAWQRGETGIAIVDAGMRQLWDSGWMHNRVRMLVGSLLTKNLGIHWQAGARWFWDTLVDADLASNTLGWQWIAGCGADAAPYFRIFNPDTQAEKFDPDGAYRQRWLGQRSAPEPIVDLKTSRQRALDAYQDIRKGSD